MILSLHTGNFMDLDHISKESFRLAIPCGFGSATVDTSNCVHNSKIGSGTGKSIMLSNYAKHVYKQ